MNEINNIPKDILIIILNKCIESNCFNCLFVCKYWNNTSKNCIELQKRFFSFFIKTTMYNNNNKICSESEFEKLENFSTLSISGDCYNDSNKNDNESDSDDDDDDTKYMGCAHPSCFFCKLPYYTFRSDEWYCNGSLYERINTNVDSKTEDIDDIIKESLDTIEYSKVFDNIYYVTKIVNENSYYFCISNICNPLNQWDEDLLKFFVHHKFHIMYYRQNTLSGRNFETIAFTYSEIINIFKANKDFPIALMNSYKKRKSNNIADNYMLQFLKIFCI
jgi:hypothetical protein